VRDKTDDLTSTDPELRQIYLDAWNADGRADVEKGAQAFLCSLRMRDWAGMQEVRHTNTHGRCRLLTLTVIDGSIHAQRPRRRPQTISLGGNVVLPSSEFASLYQSYQAAAHGFE
jgi:hypothetical protein